MRSIKYCKPARSRLPLARRSKPNWLFTTPWRIMNGLYGASGLSRCPRSVSFHGMTSGWSEALRTIWNSELSTSSIVTWSRARATYSEIVSGKMNEPRPRFRLNPYMTLVTLLEPALDSLREPTERLRATCRSLRILNAFQTRVAAGSDIAPKLADLGLPVSATIDPFNDELLHVKKLSNGWVVYSVGKNRVDDAGMLDKNIDIGVGPAIVGESAHKH